MNMEKNYKIETKCLHAGYEPKNGEPGVMPIVQSTTYRYDSTQQIGDLFDLKVEGHMYSRLSNPTVDAVEKKIAALEGGVGALCTSSGQAATLLSILNIAKPGDHIISASTVYGGTVNLFMVNFKRLNIEVTLVNPDLPLEELQKYVKENTKAVFGETIANPALKVLDIEKMAELAHSNNIPLIVDNTFATPMLCRPIEFGADIVVHSTTKYMDGHATTVGGVIVDSGNFDWTSGKFEEFTVPDESYHGLVYTEKFGKAAFIVKARVQLMRDYGTYPSALAAFILNLGLETLHVRMERYCENALKVAEFLNENSEIESITYPGLKGDKYYELSQKYLSKGASGVIAVVVKGGKERAARFMDALNLVIKEVHVADIRTCILHPATSTHRQLTDEQLVNAGISGGLVRLSVGIENADDIIADLAQALETSK